MSLVTAECWGKRKSFANSKSHFQGAELNFSFSSEPFSPTMGECCAVSSMLASFPHLI